MNRLKLYILLFCLALSVPLSFVIWRTYKGLEQEEWAQLRFFSETLFDEMEKELAQLVQREENRAVDEYNPTMVSTGNRSVNSPLAGMPKEEYILGYFQNNPDGAMQTPLSDGSVQGPTSYRPLIDQLQQINQVFNQKKFALPTSTESFNPASVLAEQRQPPQAEKKDEKEFSERYLAPSKLKAEKKSYLGQKSVRVEEISPRQAANIAASETPGSSAGADSAAKAQAVSEEDKGTGSDLLKSLTQASRRQREQAPAPAAGAAPPVATAPTLQRFEVEVAPLQSVFIDAAQVFIFRRVAINNQVFRQGFVLKLQPFLSHLAQVYFSPQPMAGFTRLRLMVINPEGRGESVTAGVTRANGRKVAARLFPAPFNFISAEVLGDRLPSSATRRTLNMALIALGAVMLPGLLTIYQSVRAVVALSERRSQFVSSVTHELKTPLTNIRMYVEMLEQGIAATPEREQEYLGIIGSESGRLSRLINNVLELSKLEKKQRRVQMTPGRLEEVIAEVKAVMAPKLTQEGFELVVQVEQVPQFNYDREAMIQILINLIENSIKFGRNAPQRRITLSALAQDGTVRVIVSDTGPGIPRHALNKVFDDFYRADNALTQATPGTGIGLALVKKLVLAMGGRVQAANNDGPGCTITLWLPLQNVG